VLLESKGSAGVLFKIVWDTGSFSADFETESFARVRISGYLVMFSFQIAQVYYRTS
jgi:hypothetical protein